MLTCGFWLVAGEGLEDNLDVSPEERRYLARLDAGLFPLQRLCHALALLYASTKKVQQQHNNGSMSCCSPCMDSHTPHPHPCCMVAQLRSYVGKKMREQGGSFLKAKATLDGEEMATRFVFVHVLALTAMVG